MTEVNDIKYEPPSHWSPGLISVWEKMGRQHCGNCGRAMEPCPKGPGADEPGYVGFYGCQCHHIVLEGFGMMP